MYTIPPHAPAGNVLQAHGAPIPAHTSHFPIPGNACNCYPTEEREYSYAGENEGCLDNNPGCCIQGYDNTCRIGHIHSFGDTPSGPRVTDFMSSKNPIEAVSCDCGGKAQCRERVSFEQWANGELACGAADRARESFLDEKEREINKRLRVLEERERATYWSVGNINPNHQGM